jgi:hypothetical protein
VETVNKKHLKGKADLISTKQFFGGDGLFIALAIVWVIVMLRSIIPLIIPSFP